MKKNFILIVLSLFLIESGWAQSKNSKSYTTYTTTKEFQVSQARGLDVRLDTCYVKPLVVEVEIDSTQGRIQDEWVMTKEKLEVGLRGNMQNIYAYGLFKSTQAHKADIIIAPSFDLRLDNRNGQDVYILTVIGFPANFKNWATMKESDYEWLKIKREFNNPQVIIKDNKHR